MTVKFPQNRDILVDDEIYAIIHFFQLDENMSKTKQRCFWVPEEVQIYIDYHDKEWGVPVYDERLLFEFINLEGMQAGLSWLTVLKKRENYKLLFDNFNAEKIAEYDEDKYNSLLNEAGIIRNRLKIRSIISNAQALLKLKEEFDTFTNYLWNFVDGKPLQTHRKNKSEVPAKTDISDKMSKDLKKRGFNFVGSTICYAFMQAIGMVNDHTTSCFCYEKLFKSGKK